VVAAGRRSGKTELAKRRLVMALAEKKPWKDARYFAAAPTRDQAKRVFWQDLKAMVPQRWVKKVYEGDLCIKTRFSTELWVVGLDRPQRIEGIAWDGGVLDEYADMRPMAWTENIRPALADRTGWCWFTGVPNGFNHFKNLADYARSGEDPDWGFYHWNSSDILPPAEIESARRTLDPRTFRQEFEASFEGATGRVYYAYQAEKHMDSRIQLDPALPIVLSCDFNVDPCIWVLAQTNGREVFVFDEIALRNTNTLEMGREFLRRYGAHKGGIIVYGDSAGSARSTTGKTDYVILAELGLSTQRIRRSNPPVKDRVNAVNSMLENVREERRLFHHPRCRYLKKDFESVVWTGDGASIDKSNFERTHASDALGYFIEYEFPLRTTRFDPAKRFYK